ncbi:MAG: site-2 protease family protein [Patescibacteria group bacterium]
MLIILSIVILIMSVVVHELAHGYMADWLGDSTARRQGRLTLNPVRHLDPVGSVIVPLVTSLLGFTFGWARPVEYNPHNLKNRRSGELLIALAGPASNLLIAFVFSMVIRFAVSMHSVASIAFIELSAYIVTINIILAIFNLIPLPPLDGSKILFAILPRRYAHVRAMLEMYAPIFVLLVVFFLWQVVSPLVPFVFRLFTGLGM